jgi:molybdopterin molybdotransferase
VDPTAWPAAVTTAWAAGQDLAPAPERVPLLEADGLVLAEPLTTRTHLPAFPTSSVDGWATRGDGPWRITGRVLAGQVPAPLATDGECVEIATGAMVPAGTTAIVRLENATVGPDGRVTGVPRERPEWRLPGEEADVGEELLAAGTAITPALVGLAASAGHDDLLARRPARAAVLVFGDELLRSGPPGDGRIRDALGPQLPAWLHRLGAHVDTPSTAPVADTREAHVTAIQDAIDKGTDLICTTGGTMHGPVDHLHQTLANLDATYLVNTVAVRPGYPMLLARLPAGGGRTALLVGLPGNPQSAVVGLLTLVAPVLAGWLGRPKPDPTGLPRVPLGAPIPGRGGYTHLALVRWDPTDGLAYPVPHAGSAMLRGVATAVGFAIISPNHDAVAGDHVPLLPLPLLPGELPLPVRSGALS